METAKSVKGNRSDPPIELGTALVPRKTDPIPVVTRSSEVSRVQKTSAMDTTTRSGAWEVCSSVAIPAIETRPEPEIVVPAEIQVSMSHICEKGLGATRSCICDTASQYVTADKPEIIAAFTRVWR